jgi:hypothetical protein
VTPSSCPGAQSVGVRCSFGVGYMSVRVECRVRRTCES